MYGEKRPYTVYVYVHSIYLRWPRAVRLELRWKAEYRDSLSSQCLVRPRHRRPAVLDNTLRSTPEAPPGTPAAAQQVLRRVVRLRREGRALRCGGAPSSFFLSQPRALE